MSEGDVSLIRDEDVLRRMWQQTEDFSRKKEIRAHMYRLREERLRDLYSPEPPAGKRQGCEFTSAQGHVKSFADQTFQSMKSKEVRDAGSPPKEFTYRGQDLKEHSNAGWNVESENRTTDDGHTQVKSVQANIEGSYDVEGGRGQFSARDQHTRAATEYHDDNSSLKRDQSSSNTAAHEQVVRETDGGSHFSSITNSSTSTSNVQQVSSTKHVAVPYVTNNEYDLSQQTSNTTNRNEQAMTRREVTNDYEQTTRKNDLQQGELVSRKVDYPDDNTKVVVETRCLPDGTRVTSTRREFRAPVVQCSRSEQHSQKKSESKTYQTSSQQKSDIEEYTSKITHQNIDNQSIDIVSSQKTSDTNDFKQDQEIHYVGKDDTYDSQYKIDRNQFVTNLEQINNKREVISEDFQKQTINERDMPHNVAERVYHTTKDRKIEDVVERKATNDQYQTTYNSDYTQKKVSNDWSPTQQAWASTLRADTPTSTRPSTRASSPGGRTFQSSTSSLRSSVSPDKACRKPPSRGSSPSKVDRSSPTRRTHFSQSVTETKTTRYISPEGRPPHGRSPTRHSQSPEKMPQRKSVSPDKTPQTSNEISQTNDYASESENQRRQSPSPDRKPNNVQANNHPRNTSPPKSRDRDTVSPMHLSQSPSREQGQANETKSGSKLSQPNVFPYCSSVSPDKNLSGSLLRDLSPTKTSRPLKNTPDTERHTNRHPSPSSTFPLDRDAKIRLSTSPDRKLVHQPDSDPSEMHQGKVNTGFDKKPGYMRATAASNTTSDFSKNAPVKSSVSPDRKSPPKSTASQAHVSKITEFKKDHYTFIDEETKMYSRTDNKNIAEHIVTESEYVTDIQKNKHSKSPSPKKNNNYVGSPNNKYRDTPRPTLRKDSRSPSPSKGPVTFTEDHITETRKTQSIETLQKDVNYVSKTTEDVTKPRSTSKDKNPLATEITPTLIKPSTKNLEESSNETQTTISDEKISLSTRRDKSPRKGSDPSSSQSRKTPRESLSPVKRTSKDTQYKMTTDFITSEKTTEELNKKSVLKDHPRQLVTPSTSPTRKSKLNDTAPSTGQSSPTTSVSGFVYFGSPSTEKTIVTDLDDQESYTEMNDSVEYKSIYKRPESLDIKRSPSPSKIPCKSPSQEKRSSPTTENLPRKSSLKKSSFTNQISPTEKPPSSFRVSPTTENQEHPEHKIVKKDTPEKPAPSVITKPKPPLERRETYEDRCRKILGMMDDNKKQLEKNKNKEPVSNLSSPSVSPCLTAQENLSFEYKNKKDMTITHSNVIDFITCEKKEISQQREKSPVPYKTIPSRDSSPTKLQDIISTHTKVKQYGTTCNTDHSEEDILHTKLVEDRVSRKNSSERTPRQSPANKTRSYVSPEKKLMKELPKRNSQSPDKSPDKRPEQLKTREYIVATSPNKTFLERKSILEKHTENNKSTAMTRQETYDVEESQVLNNSTLPREPKFISPARSVAKTPSPPQLSQTLSSSSNKTKDAVIEKTVELIISEREQDILDRVKKSLRKLSPERSDKLPSRGNSPTKSTTSFIEIDISTNEYREPSDLEQSEDMTDYTNNIVEKPSNKLRHDLGDYKIASKPSSRNASPVKKTTIPSPAKSPDSTNKSRSISPKKHITAIERPQSPQVLKTSGVKAKEVIKKPMSPNKTEKCLITSDVKKNTTKQNSLSKTSTNKTVSKITQYTTNKLAELESKRIPTSKSNNNTSKKEPESRVIRTTSDISIKTKKSSPQRIKSKPEIKVSDASITKSPKTITTNKLQKDSISIHHSILPSKPKSATALNTSTDEDDVIIDVQQAKSSRENSPDRICPTPINFTDDIGTPRYPDEVNEPDDEFRQRTYNTINEVESIVDDIVEICEDDELFVKRKDECFLSFNDNVSNLTNKADKVLKTKDTTKQFKDTEKRMHSDFLDDNLKSDECLLTVSEKVTKFAKGPRDTKDSRSPCRKIVDEYDKNTTYQDDYTKLSVNDKAHFFVETAENIKTNKIKPAVKVDRQDLTDVDESLKSDDCLLSVSDKVNKFVKTAEQFLTHSVEVGEKEKKIKEQHDIIMRKIVENVDNNINNLDANKILTESSDEVDDSNHDRKTTSNTHDEKRGSFSKETASSHAKVKDFRSHNLKPTEKTPIIKITTLRSSEAVKKAKALFENITTTQKTNVKTTKLTDIGVMKKSPKTDSTIVLHPSLEDGSPDLTDVDSEIDAVPHKLDGRGRPLSRTPVRSQPSHVYEDKPRSGAARLSTQSPDISRTKTKIPQSIETTATLKSVTTQQPAQRAVSPYLIQAENEKLPQEKAPGYQRPTKTSQLKEEIKTLEETEVSSRRGSGKFGVELRRTSVERSTVSSERRRSVEHHQPCIEDIFDLDLLEQMLEKVAGYEQRRRIRAQIRIAKKRAETDIYIHKKTTKAATVTKTKSPDRQNQAKSPERHLKSNSLKTHSPDRITLQTCTQDRSQPKNQSLLNGHAKDNAKILTDQRPHSPEKLAPKVPLKAKSPVRQPSPVKKTRPTSPSKTTTTKPKSNRFNEYASAYLKKAGVSDADKVKVLESKVKKTTGLGDRKSVSQIDERVTENQSTTVSKSYIERKSSKETIERIRTNGRRTPSPEKKSSPERKVESPTERLREKSPSPVLKRQISDTGKKETIIKTVYDSDKKVLPKQAQEERPSWVTNRNLKKITSETRSFSSKKIDSDKSKYRAPSPSKVIAKPLDVITSSYGPGPRDADGKPLFGIRALRNGATNYQVKGTVIREEFHSRDGGAPEGSVSVTAYSSSAEELARLLQAQGERPSRLHGLAAITTTKTFGGDTGHSYKDVHTREERAALDQFTHSDRRVVDSRVEICDVTNSASSHEESHREDKKVEERRETPRQRGEERRERSERLERRDHRKGEERRESPRRQLQERRERTERIERRVDRKAEDKNESPRHLVEERREQSQRTEPRQDRKTVRQSSVKSLTEKYIKIASEAPKPSSAYPKAGLILRTAAMKDSVSSDSSQHAGLARTDSEHSLGSVEDVVVSSSTGRGGHVTTTTTTTTTRSRAAPAPASAPAHAPAPASASFLDSSTKVTGVQDILTRMKNADIVIREGDTCEDSEARALLNKFLGATVLMAGMQGYVTDQQPAPKRLFKESVRTSSSQVTSSTEEVDLEQCWDERLLRKLLDECTDTEQRRRLRARIRSLMAEQEACATAVTEALAAAGEAADGDGTAREEEEVTTVTSSVRRNSSEKTISSSTTTKTSKVIESMTRPAPKPVSPFAKFRQLEKQNSTNSPNSPKSPQSPGSPSQPFFKFTDPALQASALTIKERLLQWCRDKTRDYENVKLENFSTSWADGLAFCALLHHFLPDAFDYSRLSADKRRHNFTLAFKVADEKAGIYPLLDVDDMVAMRKPDWKCVFTYVQSIHRRFKDQL